MKIIITKNELKSFLLNTSSFVELFSAIDAPELTESLLENYNEQTMLEKLIEHINVISSSTNVFNVSFIEDDLLFELNEELLIELFECECDLTRKIVPLLYTLIPAIKSIYGLVNLTVPKINKIIEKYDCPKTTETSPSTEKDVSSHSVEDIF